jgi:RNA polymerase sigma-70 factor (sigma-E family)
VAVTEEFRVSTGYGGPAAGDSPALGDPTGWDADTAVAQLYAVHWRGLVRLAALLMGESASAEEVVADAFVAMHRRWERLADPHAAHAYLRASVVNGCRSVHRHRDVEVRYRQPAAPEPAGPEEHALRADEDQQVMAALRRLPRRQQEVLVLRYYADASEAEIADSLGISRGAVKSHAHRGLRSLREALSQEEGR